MLNTQAEGQNDAATERDLTHLFLKPHSESWRYERLSVPMRGGSPSRTVNSVHRIIA